MVLGEESTLAYLGGFFDGEGCVGVYDRNDRPGTKKIIASVAQVDPRPIRMFQSLFGGTIGIQRKNEVGRSNLFRIQYTGEKAKDVLANLYPYLVVKRGKAAAALET